MVIRDKPDSVIRLTKWLALRGAIRSRLATDAGQLPCMFVAEDFGLRHPALCWTPRANASVGEGIGPI